MARTRFCTYVRPVRWPRCLLLLPVRPGAPEPVRAARQEPQKVRRADRNRLAELVVPRRAVALRRGEVLLVHHTTTR